MSCNMMELQLLILIYTIWGIPRPGFLYIIKRSRHCRRVQESRCMAGCHPPGAGSERAKGRHQVWNITSPSRGRHQALNVTSPPRGHHPARIILTPPYRQRWMRGWCAALAITQVKRTRLGSALGWVTA